MAPALDFDALPHPGTQPFLPSLLARIRAALPGLPLEPVIVQVLLLSVVAGDRNLILRTRDEDIGLITKLTTLTLGSVFGYTVHKLRCHTDAASQTPAQFLLSLFFSPLGDGSLPPSHKSRERHRRTSSPWNPGGKPPGAPPAPIITGHGRKSSFSQSASCASDSRPSTATSPLGFEEQGAGDVGQAALAAHSRRAGVQPSAMQTESSMTKSHQRNFSQSSAETLTVPTAVVVSGLEHAGLSAQKTLLRTLAERKLLLPTEEGASQRGAAFDLPENFILVYVCRLDARERPLIYKSLLDRFAMSSPVNVSQQTRLALRQYRPHPMATSVHSPSHTLGISSPPGPLPPFVASPVMPVLPPSFLHHLKNLRENHTYIQPSISIYLADLFTATRHFGCLDGTLLTVRAKQDAEALVRASRVLGVDPTGTELVKEAANDAPPLTELDTSSTERDYSRSRSTASTSSDALLDDADVPATREPSLAPSTRRSLTGMEEPPELDVSEADVARMFPRVVSHRLRVRDSPYDEVLSSLVCGAVGRPTGPGGGEPVWERDGVKDVLVQILSEV